MRPVGCITLHVVQRAQKPQNNLYLRDSLLKYSLYSLLMKDTFLVGSLAQV